MSIASSIKDRGKRYTYVNSYDTKAEATASAERIRRAGGQARVIYQRKRKVYGKKTYAGKPWAVYSRRQ